MNLFIFIINIYAPYVSAKGSLGTLSDARLEFDVTLIAYKGDGGWVEETIQDIYQCLNNDGMPGAGPDCDYCGYVTALRAAEY